MFTRRSFLGMLAAVAAAPRRLLASAPRWTAPDNWPIFGSEDLAALRRPMPIVWGSLSDDGFVPPPAIYIIRSLVNCGGNKFEYTLRGDNGTQVDITTRLPLGDVGDQVRWTNDDGPGYIDYHVDLSDMFATYHPLNYAANMPADFPLDD